MDDVDAEGVVEVVGDDDDDKRSDLAEVNPVVLGPAALSSIFECNVFYLLNILCFGVLGGGWRLAGLLWLQKVEKVRLNPLISCTPYLWLFFSLLFSPPFANKKCLQSNSQFI